MKWIMATVATIVIALAVQAVAQSPVVVQPVRRYNVVADTLFNVDTLFYRLNFIKPVDFANKLGVFFRVDTNAATVERPTIKIKYRPIIKATGVRSGAYPAVTDSVSTTHLATTSWKTITDSVRTTHALIDTAFAVNPMEAIELAVMQTDTANSTAACTTLVKSLGIIY